MFQTLTQNLTKIFDKIKGAGALTEAHIDSAMRDIRIALLEADVALPVVRAFISEVSEKAKGVEVVKSVSPAQMVIKIINDEMIRLLQPDENESKINLQSVPPVNLLIVGLQGSGKTTASAKLALKLKSTGKKVLLVSLDTYRPAAQDQLEILAKSIEVDSLPIIKEQLPIAITERAITAAKLSGYDVVIYDTAGRLHIDDDMINEAIKVKSLVKPTETFLVMDAMIGQDAVNVASNFNHKLDITGVILSRIDGDSKGGAALSVRYITGKPIKFLSTGEKPDEFEEFDAKRIASRILDMGDVVSFVERAASVIDRSEAEKTAAKLKKGQFDLDDYISQIKMIKKMGGLGSMMNFLPGISKLSDKIGDLSSGEKALVSQMAIVNSMTKKERKNPDILNASRKKRVATGSGTTVQQVNILLKQFKQISTTMKKVSRMNPKTLLRSGIGKLFS
ncbi:MAG: signal recognition particle protein [Alphaproteobacteria bacterium]|jgi:signal recognition particle subunit SRP54|nr:signal recognition particle protein [Rickettsiales bacterium]MCE2730866.1 signal recognition particle protein [Rickettsiaceae bacterium]NBU52951.1 signal recognition particle protein [Alphaproteobacteria bacterium]UCM94324.1 MAG: signal recognition particle protein [Candidatus Megaira endosymbiont of Mesostigma viride]NBY35320.1 signal recognition particle protein [Alphaproteobacteria bacterium]